MSTSLQNSRACRIREVPGFSLPDEAKIVINFTLDFDTVIYRRFLGEPALWTAQGEFGGRVGVWRFLELFREFGVKATFFVPGQTALLYPEAVRQAAREGHEVANHMWDHHIPSDFDEEKEHIRKTDAVLRRLSGRRPQGTRSEHDLAALEGREYSYVSYMPQGEKPFYIWTPGVGKWVLNLPINFVYDDAMFFYFGWFGSQNAQQRIQPPSAFLDVLLEGYAAARQSSGYMNICVHPNVGGRACRMGLFREFFTRIAKDAGVAYTTSAWFAEYILTNFPAGE